MSWFTYKCETHGNFKVSLEKREKTVLCPVCAAESKSVIKVPSISIVEKLDNGAMGRSVERLHNIDEIMNDRSDKHDVETGADVIKKADEV